MKVSELINILQKYDGNMEVIVIDDNDSTARITDYVTLPGEFGELSLCISSELKIAK